MAAIDQLHEALKMALPYAELFIKSTDDAEEHRKLGWMRAVLGEATGEINQARAIIEKAEAAARTYPGGSDGNKARRAAMADLRNTLSKFRSDQP